uniref:Uncharacterized protein n=1 Tax=Romanomermis culicivorax TaxID=13658 RepID=A0A915IVT9_ROMCU
MGVERSRRPNQIKKIINVTLQETCTMYASMKAFSLIVELSHAFSGFLSIVSWIRHVSLCLNAAILNSKLYNDGNDVSPLNNGFVLKALLTKILFF